MLGGFVTLFSLGHIPVFFLFFFCQVMMFKEVKRISNVLRDQKALPSFRPLHWYWFSTATFFAYGRVLDFYFHLPIPYHALISFLLYVGGIVLFVFSLEKSYYRFQFEMFGFVHLTLFFVVLLSTFIVVNLFQGIIWFVLPALLIISNDSWAYVFGFFFGRTPLISISPKKTWEGFIGAAVATIITGVTIPVLLSQFELLYCPKHDLTFSRPHCEPPDRFLLATYHLPNSLLTSAKMFGVSSSEVSLLPVQIDGLVLAVFASIIAPFGGFFASGLKRAFGIKDFGESIPGHGGVTDRMDCQILMGLFAFVYYNTFVNVESMPIEGVMEQFALLSTKDQLIFYHNVQSLLRTKGII